MAIRIVPSVILLLALTAVISTSSSKRSELKSQRLLELLAKRVRGNNLIAKTRVKRQGTTNTVCNGEVQVLTGADGSFSSPNYGQQTYPSNANCVWKIEAPEGYVIRLQFSDPFDIEALSECQYDNVTVWDGSTPSSPMFGYYCGDTTPDDIISSTSALYIRFRSDETEQHVGFRATYQLVHGSSAGNGNGGQGSGNTGAQPSPTTPDTANACPTNLILDSTTGIINSPSDSINSLNYPNNVDCSWRITAPTSHKIRLTKAHFDLEDGSGCAFDFLSVHDGENANSLLLGKFCSSNFPGVVSTGSDLYIRFKTDETIQASGFSLLWEFVAPEASNEDCGGSLGGSRGRVKSPRFGANRKYPNNAECKWTIDVGPNKHVKLSASSFTIEDGTNCMYDSVSIYDGQDKQSTLLGTFCGMKSNLTLESTGQFMFIEFLSDNTVQDKGFNFLYIAQRKEEGPKVHPGCDASRPAVLTETEGTITSPSAPSTGNYPDNSFCQWRISVPAGKRAHLHFTNFSLEPANQCQYDNVEVFDGPDGSASKFDRYCGSDMPGDITGSSNTIMVQFKSDSSITDKGFAIRYSAKDLGGTSNPDGGNGAEDNEPACGISDVSPKFERIVGGIPVAVHSWPWQISLRFSGSHICGGSILSKRWIITAAHCVVSGGVKTDANLLSVRAGENDMKVHEGSEQDLDVAEVIPHEYYGSDGGNGNDIALLRLASDITYSIAAKPVCLPRSEAPADMLCITTGWGETQGTGDSSVLNQVRVPILNRELCKQPSWYGALFTDVMICAGYPEGEKDSCQGDSGGPLVCLEGGVYRLQGLTSWGFGCAQARNPGIYTRVVRFYDWVDAKTSGAFQSPS